MANRGCRLKRRRGLPSSNSETNGGYPVPQTRQTRISEPFSTTTLRVIHARTKGEPGLRPVGAGRRTTWQVQLLGSPYRAANGLSFGHSSRVGMLKGLLVTTDGHMQLIDVDMLGDDLPLVGAAIDRGIASSPANHIWVTDTDPDGDEYYDVSDLPPNPSATRLAGTRDMLFGDVLFLGGPPTDPVTGRADEPLADVNLAALGISGL